MRFLVSLSDLFLASFMYLLNVKHVRMVLQVIVTTLSNYLSFVHNYDFICKVHKLNSMGD